MRDNILVETDFLFGLNVRDKLYPYVIELLERHRKRMVNIVLSPAAPLEASLVMLSRGFSLDKVVRVLKLMDAKLIEYKVYSYTPLTLDIMVRALETRSKYPRLTLFDSIHIATAKVTGYTLVTSDKTIARVMEREGLDYIEYHDIV